MKAGEEAKVEEVPFAVYKPIEIWKCNGVEAAIALCEENKDRDCWVYLEVTTDSYIREDQIKAMKDLKKDILEITPKLTSIEEEEEEVSLSELKFDEIFKGFYKKERGVDADNELVELLLSIVNEEGEKDETN